MAALRTSWNQAAVRLKSKVSFSSSAVTTRVTSAARAERAETPSSVSAPRIAQDFQLKVTALKDGADDNTRGRSSAIGRRGGIQTARLHGLFLAQAELLHLRLEALARDLELARRLGDVAARLVERPLDELALDPLGLGADRLLERLGGRAAASPRRRAWAAADADWGAAGAVPPRAAGPTRGSRAPRRTAPSAPSGSRARGCCRATGRRRGARSPRA